MSDKFDFLKNIENVPSNLIKGLQAVQSKEGYVSDEAIEAVGRYFNVAPVEVEGVLSFYAQFKRVKPGKYKIAVCDGTAFVSLLLKLPTSESFLILALFPSHATSVNIPVYAFFKMLVTHQFIPLPLYIPGPYT